LKIYCKHCQYNHWSDPFPLLKWALASLIYVLSNSVLGLCRPKLWVSNGSGSGCTILMTSPAVSIWSVICLNWRFAIAKVSANLYTKREVCYRYIAIVSSALIYLRLCVDSIQWTIKKCTTNIKWITSGFLFPLAHLMINLIGGGFHLIFNLHGVMDPSNPQSLN
jgi:hypothetical protein